MFLKTQWHPQTLKTRPISSPSKRSESSRELLKTCQLEWPGPLLIKAPTVWRVANEKGGGVNPPLFEAGSFQKRQDGLEEYKFEGKVAGIFIVSEGGIDNVDAGRVKLVHFLL
ncbi:hypothetical protein CDAR_608051 [Caerostris darwini]|uniref:Uncharacterized protein n=1 Tax=Caerostris darwini TaxID=1538125 RepID=A0AAV4Q0F1_9ARAC|nr:hypothetical protein CDAR_608051 [Caerostris darwini]